MLQCGEERNGTPGATRTPDQLLRRQLLYPLSYGGLCHYLYSPPDPIPDAYYHMLVALHAQFPKIVYRVQRVLVNPYV